MALLPNDMVLKPHINIHPNVRTKFSIEFEIFKSYCQIEWSLLLNFLVNEWTTTLINTYVFKELVVLQIWRVHKYAIFVTTFFCRTRLDCFRVWIEWVLTAQAYSGSLHCLTILWNYGVVFQGLLLKATNTPTNPSTNSLVHKYSSFQIQSS